MLESVIFEYNTNTFFMYYICAFVCILGLVFGSFLNVVGLRFLSGESIVLPPSKCPTCHTKLKWYDNIPVLSYLLLIGKCRYCKTHISVQYPVVESLTGLMFLLVFLKFGFTYATLMLWVLFCGGIVMCITDFREQVIFDAISMPLVPIGLVYSFFNLGKLTTYNVNVLHTGFIVNSTFVDALIGTISAFLIFEILSLFSRILIQQRAFGAGDTIIAMIFGAWFGWKVMLLTSLLAVIIQALFTFPLMIANLIKIKDKTAIISFSALLMSAVIPILLNRLQLFNNIALNLLFVVLILGIALISSMVFLRRMRELKCFTMLPFGPALIIAGFIASMYLADYIPNLLN